MNGTFLYEILRLDLLMIKGIISTISVKILLIVSCSFMKSLNLLRKSVNSFNKMFDKRFQSIIFLYVGLKLKNTETQRRTNYSKTYLTFKVLYMDMMFHR